MRDQSKKLDALVNRRNNIAHGGREQKLEDSDIDDYRTLVLTLMESLEKMLERAVQSASFRRSQTSSVPPVAPEASTEH